jgi:hypothetical protein
MVATNPDPLGGPIRILPAQRDQLALPQTRHRRRQVERSIERLVVTRHRRGCERIDLDRRQEADLV